MGWPELERHLSEQEYFDLVDEFADQPDNPFQGLAARTLPGVRCVPSLPDTPCAPPAVRVAPGFTERFHKPAAASPFPAAAAAPRVASPLPPQARGALLLCECVECDRGRQWLDGRSCGPEAPD